MPKFIKRLSRKAGAAPGTLMHIGEQKSGSMHIAVLDYDSDHLEDHDIDMVEDILSLKDRLTVSWINIDGLHDVAQIEKVGQHFKIHPLTLEDILNTGQRPKTEDYEDYLYFVLKMLRYDEAQKEILSEQVSLILSESVLISFQERVGDVFDPVRERIRKGKGRIRKRGVDYLAYALIDAVVDNYFVILEKIGDRIEDLEEALLGDPAQETLAAIHELKREMIYMRKQVWPLREMINTILKGDSELVEDASRIFFRDVYDHTIQIIDTIESYRDILSGLTDLYLSTISNRMNEVMKVLTIIATIFIPITFLAGIYGMNFKYMPELERPWAYPLFWIIIIAVAVGMLVFFRRRKWL